MPQTCPSCLWISGDDTEECERCGERFDGRPAPPVKAEAVGSALSTVVGVLAVALLGAILWQRLNAGVPGLADSIKHALGAFYAWLLGPNEIFKPYLVMMLVVTLITWFVLWLLARLR